MYPLLAPRDPLTDIKTTLSSWDNCMAKSYCKWPVIAAIIIGGIIALSVIICLIRCICCGVKCVCCCFRCCGCGGGERKEKSGHERMPSDSRPIYPTEYAQAPYASNPYSQAHAAAPPPPPPPMNPYPVDQQYQSHAAPMFNPQTNPQFATFDASTPNKPANEDALPPMPIWKDARSVQVEVEETAVPEKRGDMEMDRLNYNGSVTAKSSGVGGGAAMGMSTARRTPAPGPISPVSPLQDNYNNAPAYQNDSFVSAAPQRNNPDLYNRPYAQQNDYRRQSLARDVSPVYDISDNYAQNQQPYAQSQQTYNQPQQPQEPYTQQQSYGRQSPAQVYTQSDPYNSNPSYSQPDRYDSPAPPSYATNDYYNNNNNNNNNNATITAAAQPRSNTPGYSQPQRSYTPISPSEYSQTTSQPQGPSRSNTPAYPGQQTYQAFRPAELPAQLQPQSQPQQQQQYSGVMRKAVDGTYRDI